MSDDTIPVPSTVGPLRLMDGRVRLVQVAKRTRRSLVQALGGDDAVTPQQRIAIQMIAEAEALRQSLFAEVANGTPINVGDFSTLAATGQRGLKLIGMRRVAKDVRLADYLEAHTGRTETAQETRSASDPADDTGGAA
jgi:hypothetical protein